MTTMPKGYTMIITNGGDIYLPESHIVDIQDINAHRHLFDGYPGWRYEQLNGSDVLIHDDDCRIQFADEFGDECSCVDEWFPDEDED